MRRSMKKLLSVVLAVSLLTGCTGCNREEKEPKPTPKATAKVTEGNANASERGEGQADVPLVIACGKFTGKFNPFSAVNEADRQAVALTQIQLVANDRAGKLIYHGIDGELRQYKDKNYTYYSATNLNINYDKKTDSTEYRITLRDDLVFSNGEKLTIDDVIFTMYVLCDNDYKGSEELKNMPIEGLLNYQADSSRAEKLSEKEVQRYIKKAPKALTNWVDKNITEKGITGREAKRLTERRARLLLAQGTGKHVKDISGIQKINDYELTVRTTGYLRQMSAALQIPVCALSYYGDTEKFNIEKNCFGFKKGDISSILEERKTPMGAGAYRFVKMESNVAYFISNELYYLGCPQIAYLQLKDMTETLKESRQQLLEKQQAESETPAPSGEGFMEEELMKAVPVAEATELSEGVVDVISGNFVAEEIRGIMRFNSNGELSGNTIRTELVGDGEYHYIGIHGKNVSVGKKPGSRASRSLRKALATVFSASRGVLKENDGELVRIVNYPVAEESWVSPEEEEDAYSIAYTKDIQGNDIFTDDDMAARKMEIAEQIAAEYLEAAGYRMKDGKAVEAPHGASLRYRIWIAEGEENALYPVVEVAQAALEEIGITLDMQKVDGEAHLEKKLLSGRQELWVDSRKITDMDLEWRYGGMEEENLFGVQDKKLANLTTKLQSHMSSDKRERIYRKCFDGILEQAVELPVCEFRKPILFSAKRINNDTIPQNSSPYYSWLNEIQKVKMK